MKRENKNFIINVAYQVVMYIFPLLTAAYVSRTLGATNLGIYSYISSIVTVVGMFCSLGISNYGNREVAKVRDNKNTLSKVFSEVYSLQLILSTSVILIYAIALVFIPLENKVLFWCHIAYLMSIGCDVSWLFFGLEKFKITLTRNFIVKLVSFAVIFLLVKSEDDLTIYTFIMVTSTLISQLYLLYLSRNYVDYNFASLKCVLYHLKPCLILFVPVIAFSVYRIMDKVMIGAISEKAQLGFYDNAEKIINIPIMVINALGTVMMPHMAYAIKNETDDFKATIKFSMRLALCIATYSAFGMVVVGKDLAVTLFGEEYLPSGNIIMALSASIIAAAWANVIRTQFLIPKSKDKIYVMSTIIGAIINLLFNSIFIPLYGALGACIGTLAAELSIVFYQTWNTRKELEIDEYLKIFFTIFINATLTMIIIFFAGQLITSVLIRISMQIVISLVLFVVANYQFIVVDFLGIQRGKKGK